MYNFKEIEEETLKKWEKEKTYEKVKKKNEKGKKFYFLQGPPYTSGRLHIGHAWNNSMKDIILRYKRMQGFNVWDRAGWDMHGLPTENAVQKKLGIRDKLEIEKYGVEKFVRECIKFSNENAELMAKDLWRLGVWMDYERAYKPIKNEFIEGIWWLIKKAHEQKRLYKGKKIMHWCASCETSLAKHELEYENLEDNSIFLKFKTKDGRFLIIFTTTPWTIPFNLAIMAHPDFDYVEASVDGEKWIVAEKLIEDIAKVAGKKFKILKKFKGKTLEGMGYAHPFEKEIDYNSLKKKWRKIHTVILSKDYVTLDLGTGLVHSAPGCGPEDFEACKPYGIDAYNELDEKGIFVNMGKFSGLTAKKDDSKFIEALGSKGALVAQDKIKHEYATCWRCHNPVIFRATEQWFLKIEDLISRLLKFNKDVKWQPEFAKKNYDNWTENLKDNGLTRQRYWGAPMPVWTCDRCSEIEVIADRGEIKKMGGRIPADLHKPWIDSVKLRCKCGGEMTRVKDVIDVWIDSGTTSWNCLEYPLNKKHMNLFPADFILEATEQIKLWFSMLQMCSVIAFDKSSYKNVYCHGMILDYQGMKMSKSLGNVISPYEVVDKYGADILRYYMCQTPAGENINFSWEDVKIKQRNLNILDNISRFILDLRKQGKPDKKLDLEDKYIISRKNSAVKKITEMMENYKIDEIISEIENLFLDLSRVYIQFTREKVNSEPGKILYAVSEVYSDILKMLAVICPFITDKLWTDIGNEESIHLSKWPNVGKIDKKLEEEFELARKIIELGLAARDKAQIGLKWPLMSARVECGGILEKEIQEIIARQLNVRKIFVKHGKEIKVELDLEMNEELENEGFAREISRAVQAERKKRGFVKKERIELEIKAEGNFVNKLRLQEDFIKERVNAKKLRVTDGKIKNENVLKLRIKDKEFEIYFKKV